MAHSILALSGSLRADSWNHKLVEHASGLARNAGAEVTLIRLRELELPIYDQDDEDANGLPPGAVRLKDLMKAHHAFLIACPEYNSSVSAALKNAIDWASRPREGEKPLECFVGKFVGLCAASPGALGGVRGLDHVREILSNVQCHVVSPVVAVGSVHEQLDDDGMLKPGRPADMLKLMVDNLVRVTGKVHA
ncbi:MAG: NADPH-dependent FMN reductase [Phycisphaerales bacterium JB040]